MLSASYFGQERSFAGRCMNDSEVPIAGVRERTLAQSPAKCSGDSEIDTRVNDCPVLLVFRKRVVYSSYTYLINETCHGKSRKPVSEKQM